MITYETLKAYKEKCEASLDAVATSIDATRESLKLLENQGVAVSAQINTLNDLMDIEANPPIVEIPIAGEDVIAKVFEERLDMPGGEDEFEVYEQRQDGVYHTEAMETVNKLHELNNAEPEA